MPGIFGLITKLPRAEAERQLLQMQATLQHEAFYTTGTWIDENAGIYLGWVNKQHSFSQGMPLENEHKTLLLAFEGEEFSEHGTAAKLRQRGHHVPDIGPNYLVHLAEEDSAFPAGLNGRFQGLLVDRVAGTAKLF